MRGVKSQKGINSDERVPNFYLVLTVMGVQINNSIFRSLNLLIHVQKNSFKIDVLRMKMEGQQLELERLKTVNLHLTNKVTSFEQVLLL